MTEPASHRLVSVQYLRGFAALVVVAAHATVHPLPAATHATWLASAFGVTLFFVISGYIMVVISGPGSFDPVDFMRRRIVRIVPLYWTVTLSVAALTLAVPSAFKRTSFDLEHIVASLLFLPMHRPSNPEVIEPLVKLGWTLNYEMFFYVVFALLAFQKGSARALSTIVLLVLLVVAGNVFAFSAAAPQFYTSEVLIGFAGGVAIGALQLEGRLRAVSGRYCDLLLLLAVAALSYAFLVDATSEPRLERQIALTLSALALVAWGLARESRGELSRQPALLFSGNASYSIYLVHMFAVGAVGAVAKAVFPQLTWLQYGATVAAGFAGGVGLGAAVHLLIEAPLLRLFAASARSARAAALNEPKQSPAQ